MISHSRRAAFRRRAPASCLALLLLSLPAWSAGGDFYNMNWAASHEDSYDHDVGGGAFDYGSSSPADLEIREELEAAGFACGDTVTYLLSMSVDDGAVGAQTVEFQVDLLADTTGRSGAAHLIIQDVEVNYGVIDGGFGAGEGGTDAGIDDDGGSTATLLDQYLTAPAFSKGAELIGTVSVDDLEAGESVVVRMDAKLACQPYSNPTGNLQADLLWAETVDGSSRDSINVGMQTIPLKQIGTLEGNGEPLPRLLKSVTTASGDCDSGVESLDVSAGDTVKYCYTVRNDGTEDLYDVLLQDDAGTSGDSADDWTVLLSGADLQDLDGDGQADDLAAGGSASGSWLYETSFSCDDSALTNIAEVTGDGGGSPPTGYSDTNTASIHVSGSDVAGALSLEVLASPDADCGDDDNYDAISVPAGLTVYWCYVIENTGSAAISDATVDTLDALGTCDLAAGESCTLMSGGDVASDDLSETATASGTTECGDAVSSDAATGTVTAVSSALAITTKVSLNDICGDSDDAELHTVLEGTEVTWCYYVQNTGEDALEDVTVNDPDADVLDTAALLLPGEGAWLGSERAVITDDEEHWADATGTNSFGTSVLSNVDDAAVDVVHPSISIEKTVSTDGTCPGDELAVALVGDHVTWCYAVTNTGDTTLNDVLVTDDGVSISLGSLAPGQSASGSAGFVATVDLPNDEATVTATDGALGVPVSDTDDASLDLIHPSISISVTVDTDGSCDGDESEIVNVLEGTPIIWCYTVTNTGDVDIDDITVSDDVFGANGGVIGSLGVGESITLSADDIGTVDLILTGIADGTDAVLGSAVTSNEDPAAVNVVYPGLEISKTVSLDEDCDGGDSVDVVAGDPVYYCMDVCNTGDTDVLDVLLNDEILSLTDVPLGDIGAGECTQYGPVEAIHDADIVNTASADGLDEYGFPVFDDDFASTNVLYANLAIDKIAPDKVILSESSTITWTLVVTSLGETGGENVVVTDQVPSSVSGVHASASQGSCAVSGANVSCALGDLAVGATATVTISGTVLIHTGSIVNSAYVDNDVPDTDASDNSDTETTQVYAGPTRTIGFYATHPVWTGMCLSAAGGSINLGFTQVATEAYDNQIDVDKDTRAEPGLELALGVFNGGISHFLDGKRRTQIGQARMQAGQQVLGAICNEQLTGASSGIDWSVARATLAGTDRAAIIALGYSAMTFNESGDGLALPANPGPANPSYPHDDPTDPND